MYEEILAEARRATQAAVRESQERVDLAVSRSVEADRRAREATKELGERWASRVNAMRRRAHDRTGIGQRRTEMNLGAEDGTPTDDDGELMALSAEPAARQYAQPATDPDPDTDSVLAVPPPSYGRHALADSSAPPRRAWPEPSDDEDYSAQSWLEGR